MIIEGQDAILEFWSNDRRFGLRLNQSHIKEVALKCTKSYPNETGGILVGFYNISLNCAEITEIFAETPDSQKGKTWFVRGIYGLQTKLNKLWLSHRKYYVGEWHFHPGGNAVPSVVDINQMYSIATLSKAHCPEPLLIIFSGKNDPEKISFKIYVFSKKEIIELR